MAGDEQRIDLLYQFDKQRHDEVTVGWLPDGRWWVDDTRERFIGWVFDGPPLEARDAAMALAGELMGGDGWEAVTAQYRPGTMDPDDVPDWPPGHGPG